MSNSLKEKAEDIGFDLIGAAPVRSLDDHADILDRWLENGYHSKMSYMQRNREKRVNPGELVAGARSVIITGMNYYHNYNPSGNKPVFARYALGEDYHKVVKDRLYLLLDWLKKQYPGTEGRVFVDTAPVLERAWAVEVGMGWIGKNSMLINKDKGSFFFLGVIVIDSEIEYDNGTINDYCGKCRKCIDACPTSAILENRIIDSNKCISYLTIENKGPIPDDYAKKLEGRVFGCDTCQDVCPWNNKAIETDIKEFEPLPQVLEYTTEKWKNISEEEFYRIFRDSPVLRAGYEGFRRNLLSS